MTHEKIESIRAERHELALRRNAVHAEAVAKSDALRLRKGDEAYLVTASSCGSAVWARRVRLESFGAKRGTARTLDGRFLTWEIRRASDILFTERADVEAFAAAWGPVAHRESKLGEAYCAAANLPNLRPAYVAASEARVAALLAEADAPAVTTIRWE